MIAGQLKLYGMQGIFFNRMLHTSSINFETKEAQLFDGEEDFTPLDDDLETRFYFTPVDVDGVTEYVTGSFTGDFKRGDNYRVTVWLLVEESLDTDESETTSIMNHG